MPLNILIVGGGIAGCSAGIGLARHGHRVRIYERRASTQAEESGAGIQLQPNVVKILDTWGMRSELEKVAMPNTLADIRDPFTGERIALVSASPGRVAWFGLRSVYRDMFKKAAIKAGCEVLEGVRIKSVDVENVAIEMENGDVVNGDVLLGADGAFSKVRRSLFPEAKTKATDNTSWQIQLDWELVRSDPVMRGLVDEENLVNTMRLAPGLTVLCFPIPKHGMFELEPIDHEYVLEKDPRPEVFNERIYDLSYLKERWRGFEEPVGRALECAKSAFKWRFTEVSGLKSWSSENGRFILLGDACHAMLPYSGQGSAMGIEDAVVLSELLANVSTGDDIKPLVKMYEKLRMPRCEKIQAYARFQGKRWSSADPEVIEGRNAIFKMLDVNADSEIRQMAAEAFANAVPDENASFGTLEHLLWLDQYDALDAVRRAMAENDHLSYKL